MKRWTWGFVGGAALAAAGLGFAQTRDPGDLRVDEGNVARWVEFIRPDAEENRWREVGWRTSLREAIPEAQRLQRPILLWTMNGHPLDCT